MMNQKILPIKATFIDEISHDIPHQNWGKSEWATDFRHMKAMGIETVVLIRSGYRKWITYPSKVLMDKENCYQPPLDLVQLFLDLALENDISFYFGLFDSGKYWWDQGDYQKEVDINKYVIEEVWKSYGHHAAFRGWYITQEVSRKTNGIIGLYCQLGQQCKEVSNGLPTLISPYVDGEKALLASNSAISKSDAISLQVHESEWGEILEGISNVVDILAFQDGQVDYDRLPDFLAINKALADKYGMDCWSNSESFDRDMPIKFLPIKWEKMRLKLQAARQAGVSNIITFEFSHFMSPQSAYPQAGHLFNRYLEALQNQNL